MLNWDNTTQETYQKLIERIPIFMRDLARSKIEKRIELILTAENRTLATEKDLVDAFFIETPFGFHGPMKSDMEAIGVNYQQYGHT